MGLLWWLVVCLWCRCGVGRLCWWLGGNCYHRRCLAACRRRVGGLWSQNPPSGCSKCSPPRWNVGDMGCLGCSGRRFGRGGWVDGGVVAGGMSLVSLWRGSSSTCLRVFVVVVWLVFVGGLGGIATIGAALRRVVGVSVVYGRKTPRVLARKGQGRVLFRWQCWSCSACLHLFVVVVWLVFVGGLGGIATIGAALRRVAGVSVVYGRKTPVCLLKVQSTSVKCG